MDWEAFYNSFRTPDFIGGYEIQNRLGGGAFGDVYKARKQSIGKAYAIKFLKIEDDSQREAVERELSQVRHFAAIDHPNLVTIEDMGSVLDVPYLIMGYAGEDTLARRFKSGSLDKDAALLYFVQACRGVLALHDRRLVHFDLKPSNIFLKGEVARVGDYGLSKLMTDGRMTLSFGRGTPQYMAPEMLRTRADHRADIYSLGVILYESLTGKLPFQTDTPGGLVLREEDTPPIFPDDFPARLRPAVERCLRLDPDDRYDSVGELLEGIDQTARLGDSVKIDWQSAPLFQEPASTPAAREGSSGVPATVGGPPSSARNVELRETAAELARASVEVARGVWDGLRGAGERVKAETPRIKGELARAGGEIGRASVEVKGALKEATASVKGAFQTSATPKSGLLERRRARKAAKAAARAERVSAAAVASMPHTALASGTSGAGTIPVPPRAEGGLIGTVFSTVVLSLEVLVSLVGNLSRGAVRLFRTGMDRALRTSGNVFTRGLRLFGFLLVMAILGAVVMTAGMLFLEAVGVRM